MSSLKITSPDCSSLFDYFVKEEHPLVFPHVNDPIPSGMFSDPAVTALTIREEAIEDRKFDLSEFSSLTGMVIDEDA